MDDEDDPLPRSLKSAAPLHSASAMADSPHKQQLASLPIPPDPWFYAIIAGWGNFYLVIGGLIAVPSAAGLIAVILSLPTGDWTSFMATLFIVLPAFGLALVFLTLSAVILLLLDLARNIRRLRIHADHDTGIVV